MPHLSLVESPEWVLADSIEDAYKVLTHPEIFVTIAEDGMECMTIEDMPTEPIYLCGYRDGVLMGCFVIQRTSTISAEVHVQVLPDFREYSEWFGRAVIEWAWANTVFSKLTALIPFTYPNVLDFAQRMGFKVEGVSQSSYLKDGTILDQWYLGLIKDQ